MLPKMYILVRKDLAETYRVVQGAHALAQYGLEHSDFFKVWNNGTVVFLGVNNLKSLRDWKLKLQMCKKRHSVFQEPDLDGQETAIACYDLGDIFKSLPLAN